MPRFTDEKEEGPEVKWFLRTSLLFPLLTWPFVHDVIWYPKLPGIVFSLFQEVESCSLWSPQYASTEEQEEEGRGEEEEEKDVTPCSWGHSPDEKQNQNWKP